MKGRENQLQNLKCSHVTDFDPLVRAIAQVQPLFENLGDRMLLAGFELPGEMYGTLDSAVVMTGEIQFAIVRQSELVSQLGDRMGELPAGVSAGMQGLFTMLEGSLVHIGETQFQSVCTLLDLLQVSELTAKASAQMLTLMSQDAGGGGPLDTLLSGLGVAAGVGGLAAAGVATTGAATTGGAVATGAAVGGAAASAGGSLALGSLGGPIGIAAALTALAAATAVGVGVSNANKKKKQMESAEGVTSRIDRLNYADEGIRSAQYGALMDNRNAWRDRMEESQALTRIPPFASDTAATDTMIDLLRKLVNKPLDRNVHSEVVIQSLRANQTLSEFKDMLIEVLKSDEQISI